MLEDPADVVQGVGTNYQNPERGIETIIVEDAIHHLDWYQLSESRAGD